jgi:hypothetical protein
VTTQLNLLMFMTQFCGCGLVRHCCSSGRWWKVRLKNSLERAVLFLWGGGGGADWGGVWNERKNAGSLKEEEGQVCKWCTL